MTGRLEHSRALSSGGTASREKVEAFNAELVVTLARFGWSLGATFGDTMHFDFIEGYSNVVPGGRSGANMKPTRYSPEGDYAPPPARRAARSR